MEQKTARLTVLIDPDKKKAFELLCGGLQPILTRVGDTRHRDTGQTREVTDVVRPPFAEADDTHANQTDRLRSTRA